MSEDQKAANQTELESAQAKAEETNRTRTGVGTRVRVGQTRGRNPMVISWEAFDEQGEKLRHALPSLISEINAFVQATKAQRQ